MFLLLKYYEFRGASFYDIAVYAGNSLPSFREKKPIGPIFKRQEMQENQITLSVHGTVN
jgi:hypothetical protein